MASPTAVERNIRALTTTIQLLQYQHVASDTLFPAKQRSYRALSKAYNHLAVLLTQGRNSENGAARQVVAVTGSVNGSGISVSALEEIIDLKALPFIPHITFTHNAGRWRDGGVLLDIKEIQPSKRSLEDLADPSKNSPSTEFPLEEHAPDLFQALVELSKDRSNGLKKFMRFVWLRCHRKIKHRIRTDNVILGIPLPELLQRWTPDEDEDIVEEQWFTVSSELYPHFDILQIPFRPHHQRRQYQFSYPTITAWCKFFRVALDRVQKLSAACDMQLAAIDELNLAFATLDMLLYDSQAIGILLSLPSLARDIQNAMSAAEQRQREKWSVKSLDGVPPDEGFDPDDDSSNPMLHYCKAIVAWLQAGLSLSRSRLFRDSVPEFHLVRSYLPEGSRQMTPLKEIMKNDILPKLRISPDIDKEALIELLLERSDFRDRTNFTGTIHCEATLMALIQSISSAEPLQPDLPLAKEYSHLFMNPDRVIGVGKKSCLCCYWLAQLLHVGKHGTFLVPGTHGMVFPWTPPPFGIPEAILQKLEQKLVYKLTEVTENWIAKHSAAFRSCRSSPVSQSSASDDEPGLLHGWDPAFLS